MIIRWLFVDKSKGFMLVSGFARANFLSLLCLASSLAAAQASVDLRSYFPAASTPPGYVRVVNTGALPANLSVARIDGTTGSVGGAAPLGGTLPAGGAFIFSAQEIEAALGTALPAGDRPRLRVMASASSIDAQSLQVQAGGVLEELSGVLGGYSVTVPTYIPLAQAGSGYTSALRVINTGAQASAVSIALVDGDTGVVGKPATLIASLASGAAQNLSAGDIEAAVGSVPAGSAPRLLLTATSSTLDVQAFLNQPNGSMTTLSALDVAVPGRPGVVDIASYFPAASASSGFASFLRLINSGPGAASVSVALLDDVSGAVGQAVILNANLAAGAARTYSAQTIEAALGVSLAASDRPRLRFSFKGGALAVQSLLAQPDGQFEDLSSMQNGTPTNPVFIDTYVPAAATGYTSNLRIINTGTAATSVTLVLIDAATGVMGNSGTLVANLLPGAARTFDASQIESVVGSVPGDMLARIQVGTASSSMGVQYLLQQPNGAYTLMSRGQAPNGDGHTTLQQSALGARPGILAALLGRTKRLLVGLGSVDVAPVQAQGLTPDIYDSYLVGAGGRDWTTWNNPSGAYVTITAQNADQLGAVPMFTLYQMATNGDGVLTGLTNAAFMTRYWSNVRLMFQLLGNYGKPVLVNLEPDFWGYTQLANPDPTQMFAFVNLDSDCANQPNTVAGIAACLVQTARQYAPNAYVGFPPSDWGGSAASVPAYMQTLGAGQADFVVAQTLDRDAGCMEAAYGPDGCNRAGSGWYWDETNQTTPNFNQYFAGIYPYFQRLQLPLLWWQTPMGVPAPGPSTAPPWRDNREHYFMTHTAQLVENGGVGVVFSPGQAAQTSIETDRGQFQAYSKAYFSNPTPLQ